MRGVDTFVGEVTVYIVLSRAYSKRKEFAPGANIFPFRVGPSQKGSNFFPL